MEIYRFGVIPSRGQSLAWLDDGHVSLRNRGLVLADKRIGRSIWQSYVCSRMLWVSRNRVQDAEPLLSASRFNSKCVPGCQKYWLKQTRMGTGRSPWWPDHKLPKLARPHRTSAIGRLTLFQDLGLFYFGLAEMFRA